MAYKSFKSLTPRNQSSLVSQLHKLINYYGEIFSTRERTYLKSLSQHDGSIYWLEDDEKKIVAVALLDPNYVFEVSGIKLHILGHTISKRPGQMDRILSHIWADTKDQTLGLLCRKTLAEVFDLEGLKLTPLAPSQLITLWPDLAGIVTDYFNVSRETLVDGMLRKDYHLYLRLSEEDSKRLSQTNPSLSAIL